MTLLPNFLKPFKSQAEKCLAQKAIKDLEFSGSTYQVLVIDPVSQNESWVFLQFDGQEHLKDSFCTCPQSEELHGCEHQAAAFLYIYSDHPLPIHKRFEKSLWNHLCRLCANFFGMQPQKIKSGKDGSYTISKESKKFVIKGQTEATIEYLEKIFFERKEETEETSIKFSNLSEEEISAWRKGQPMPALAYELSFWGDLAKRLMTLQEGHSPYTLAFHYSDKLPVSVSATFNEWVVEWPIFREWLPDIIPALKTVESPLVVHTASKGDIEKIEYDEIKQKFLVFPKKEVRPSELLAKHPDGIDLGEWLFVPKEGFYSKQPSFLEIADWDDIEKVLNEHATELKEFLVKTTLQEAPANVSYHIHFAEEWDLHIECYLFSPGDLSLSKAAFFGSWVYIPGKGFYRLAKRYFDQIAFNVPHDDVSDFISQHRIWFNSQVGFRTFLNPLEANLAYHLREDNYLVFVRHTNLQEASSDSKDFGRWIYVKGQGFFSKVSWETNLPVKTNTAIASYQIPQFIRTNRQELLLVNKFFSEHNPVSKAKLVIDLNENDQVCVYPHYEIEAEYKDKEVHYFEEFTYVVGEGFYELPASLRLPERFRSPVIIEEEDLPTFFNKDMPLLVPLAERIDPRLQKPLRHRLVATEIQHEQDPAKTAYDLKLQYETELGTLSISSLWDALQKNAKYIFSEAGMLDLSDNQFGWLKRIGKRKIDRRSNTLSLSTVELLKLNAFEEIEVGSDENEIQIHSLKILKELTEFQISEEPDLQGLRSHLRPYQELGAKWLYFLYTHSLSGLLCDEMGLGKTHQAMALLASVVNYWHKQKIKGKRHFLIVCPTSVIYHWQEKLAEFLPDLRVWTFYGTKRSLDKFYEDSDILLTSYGIWRNEVDLLSTLSFEVAIFDELQIAKNQASRIYKALTRAKARMLLGMTGTPIENQLRELKALFDIILPTYMPSEHDYKELFVKPIEKEGLPERKLLLSRLIRPFVMRRKKADVLLDLPEKIEEIAHCDLMPEQQKLYAAVLATSRERILQELQNDQVAVPYIHIFALLSHLKQICNHPAAYLKKPKEYKNYESGKWELFLELLEEARESGQKVVVFSQYLAMLDIIEDYLKEHKIDYATIRGATTNRGEQLKRFNYDPKCGVFVASLQAAGLGVDLTAGSVVIHYDRWWNAARENQATDRVHRIGQTRGVQVFKLLTKGTLEEHIDFLIAKKGRLMEEIIGFDDHEIIKKFDRQEMIKLFQALTA